MVKNNLHKYWKIRITGGTQKYEIDRFDIKWTNGSRR